MKKRKASTVLTDRGCPLFNYACPADPLAFGVIFECTGQRNCLGSGSF
ncbi:MAG: hypothetical protein H0Z40_08955 [Desulfotomaculum sp.]|nr:hypothetical protein [Desulfotomaculum sp.]